MVLKFSWRVLGYISSLGESLVLKFSWRVLGYKVLFEGPWLLTSLGGSLLLLEDPWCGALLEGPWF